MIRFCNFTRALAAVACVALTASCSTDEAFEAAGVEDESDGAWIIGVNDPETPEIAYCLPRYLTDGETRTIAEVFTGEEVTFGHLIIRTEPAKRAGMYFFVMFGYSPDAIGMACSFELSVDSNENPIPQTYKFVVPETYPTLREIKLGVTGQDWPSPDAKVNAWKLVLKSPSGKVIVEKESWLWAMKYGDAAKTAVASEADKQLTEIKAD